MRRIPVVLAALVLIPLSATAGAEETAVSAWQRAPSPTGEPINDIGGSTSALLATTTGYRLYRSTDRGATWAALSPDPGIEMGRVAFHPNLPDVAFLYGHGGIARSTDAGATWERLVANSFSEHLAIGPSGKILASVRNDGFADLLVSEDLGETWASLRLPESQFLQLYGIAFGRTENEIVARSITTMWVSHDSGATWTITNNFHGLALERGPDGTLWNAEAELRRSTDGGMTWTSVLASGLTYEIGIGTGGVVYVPTEMGLLVSENAGESWENWGHAELAYAVTSLIEDPHDTNAIYITDESVGVTRVTRSGTQTLTQGMANVPIHGLAGTPGGSIFASTPVGVYISQDGSTWRHTGAGRGMWHTIAAAASTDGTFLLAGGQNRAFQPYVVSSTDGGASWNTVALHVGGDGILKGIAVPPGQSRVAFAAVWMQLAPSAVVVTVDGGHTWRPILQIPEKVHDVAWDPAADRALVATDVGVLELTTSGLVGARTIVPATTVATSEGRSWSDGPQRTVWKGDGMVHLPWGRLPAPARDIAPISRDAAVIVTSLGTTLDCAGASPSPPCAPTGIEAQARATIVVNDRVLVGTLDGVYSRGI